MIEEDSSNKIQYVLDRLNNKKHFKAKALLEILLQGGDFSFANNSGEISYNGELVKRSHIVDLISLCTAPFPWKHWQLPGLELFMLALEEKNVPASLISNQVKEFMNADEDSAWITFEKKYFV